MYQQKNHPIILTFFYSPSNLRVCIGAVLTKLQISSLLPGLRMSTLANNVSQVVLYENQVSDFVALLWMQTPLGSRTNRPIQTIRQVSACKKVSSKLSVRYQHYTYCDRAKLNFFSSSWSVRCHHSRCHASLTPFLLAHLHKRGHHCGQFQLVRQMSPQKMSRIIDAVPSSSSSQKRAPLWSVPVDPSDVTIADVTHH